jgi:hypothetical protein
MTLMSLAIYDTRINNYPNSCFWVIMETIGIRQLKKLAGKVTPVVRENTDGSRVYVAIGGVEHALLAKRNQIRQFVTATAAVNTLRRYGFYRFIFEVLPKNPKVRKKHADYTDMRGKTMIL